MFFKPDGMKMYILGATGDDVNEYNLGTAWNVTTASYLQTFSIATQEISPTGVFFKTDGTKMYILGTAGDDVNEYNLSSAWNVSTASYLRTFYIGGQESFPNGMFFKPDGTKMYITGTNTDRVIEYDLTAPWNIATTSFVRNFYIGGQETYPSGIFIKPDGTKMYIVGTVTDAVHEYDLV